MSAHEGGHQTSTLLAVLTNVTAALLVGRWNTFSTVHKAVQKTVKTFSHPHPRLEPFPAHSLRLHLELGTPVPIMTEC